VLAAALPATVARPGVGGARDRRGIVGERAPGVAVGVVMKYLSRFDLTNRPTEATDDGAMPVRHRC